MASRTPFVLATLVAATLLASPYLGPRESRAQETPCYEPGTHTFPTTVAEVEVILDNGIQGHVALSGPTTVELSNPGTTPQGLDTIDTEIVSMNLAGFSPTLGAVVITESAARESNGHITQLSEDSCFPAHSEFNVYVDAMGGHNDAAALMATTLASIPPQGAVYRSPPEAPFVADLFLGPSHAGPAPPVHPHLGLLIHAAHIPVPEFPFLSLAAGGSSGRDPGSVYRLAAPGLLVLAYPRQLLGLMPGDDVDALAFARDHTDLRFSVRLGSLGIAGTDVNDEATKVPAEAHGDEYNLGALGFGNQLFMDEGLLGLQLPLDDLDALAEPPDSTPFYVSLAAGSPTLAANGWSAADILVVNPGGPPVVFIDHLALGLLFDDDVDGLCNLEPAAAVAGTEVFTLREGSPTLAANGWSDADLLLPGPLLTFPHPAMGLLFEDQVDALKCGEVPHRPGTPPECPPPDPPDRPSFPTTRDDPDGDGLTNQQEQALGTDPNDDDTDNDGMQDGDEVGRGTDPLDGDSDDDGWDDNREVYTEDTDPNNPDSDGDGKPDPQDPCPRSAQI